MSDYKIGGDEFTDFLDSINIHVKLTPNTLNLRSIQSVAVASSVSIDSYASLDMDFANYRS
jgi:hypothetical protein